MPKRVIVADDLAEVAPQADFVVPEGAIITERARDLAGERGISLTAAGADGAAGSKSLQAASGPGGNGRGRVALGSDHGGYELKEYLKQFMEQSGYEVEDLGTHSAEPVDYPDFARAVAERVASGAAWRGIIVDAAGIGSSIAANKIPGVRAAVCHDRATAKNSREHNDANVLTLGAGLMRPEEAREMVAVWLATNFAGGRHQRRVEKIAALDRDGRAAPAAAGREAPAGRALVEAITREVLCFLGEKQLCEARGLEVDEAVCPGCDGRCVASCPNKARRVVAAGAARLSASAGAPEIPADIAALIDHTLLKPEASRAEIEALCDEARQYGFATVCVNPTWVAAAAARLRGTGVKVCTVVGFPLGATLSGVKAFEAEQAVKLGAQELDMVINVGALKSGEAERVEQDLRGVVETAHGGGALAKVILECALLSDQEKVTGCRLAQAAGADFVKTSTGFGPGGATAHDVELMRLVVGPSMGVKAAGGIRSYADFEKMLSAGATRIGASASVKILKEAMAGEPALLAEAAAHNDSVARY